MTLKIFETVGVATQKRTISITMNLDDNLQSNESILTCKPINFRAEIIINFRIEVDRLFISIKKSIDFSLLIDEFLHSN